MAVDDLNRISTPAESRKAIMLPSKLTDLKPEVLNKTLLGETRGSALVIHMCWIRSYTIRQRVKAGDSSLKLRVQAEESMPMIP